MRISVDVGGTFTDVIVLDEETSRLRLEKVETTPRNPASGVLAGFRKAGADLAAIDYFVHGTTLGANALLTRTGARVAIVTTKGFRDVYELGRTDRLPMYDLKYRKPKPLVPRYLVFEVEERMDFLGEALTPFNRQQAASVASRIRDQGVEAVAVCFLHSYANSDHEQAMAEVLARECPEAAVTLSHTLSREYREYERTSTTVTDAYIKPVMRGYLEELELRLRSGGFGGHFLLTRSGGGAMTAAYAKESPVQSVLSGPAGGVIGAAYLSELIGHRNLITLDVGGTSLDASVIAGGQPRVGNEMYFEGAAIFVPTIEMATIGAGGGSIGWIDEGGHLQVGPQSAGALPGPVCYGKGGEEPTFTDAALAVGLLDAENFLGGELKLDRPLAASAIRKRLAERLGMSLEAAASGVLRINEAKIVGAIREISIERGFDPRDFSALAFGGAGGLVASGVAREVGIPRVVVPPGPANFSALGMLMVDVVHDFAQTYVMELETADLSVINEVYSRLARRGREALSGDGFEEGDRAFFCSVEMRYLGQEHTVNLPLPGLRLSDGDVARVAADYNRAHETQYGHRMDDPVEIVTLRLRAVGLLPRPELPRIAAGKGSVPESTKGSRPVYDSGLGEWTEYAVYDRRKMLGGDRIAGPAIVEEHSSTTVVHAGDVLTVGGYGELVIDVGADGGRQ